MSKLTVLITGGAGRIGQVLLNAYRGEYDLRAFDRRPVPGQPDAIIASLSDRAALDRALDGVDVAVHLAATASGRAPFVEQLVPHNIIGTYNVLEAAREADVRRVIFASSIQTVAAYPLDRTVEVDDPVRPVSLYGVAKALGEAMGRYYHDHHGMEFIAVRIGSFLPTGTDWSKKSPDVQRGWFSHGDAVQLFRGAIETPGIGYAIVFGTSQTERERYSLRTARELFGYEPQDKAVDQGFPPLPTA